MVQRFLSNRHFPRQSGAFVHRNPGLSFPKGKQIGLVLFLLTAFLFQPLVMGAGKTPVRVHLPPEQAQEGKEAKTVLAAGARRIDLRDFQTYGVVWFPENFAQQKDRRVLFVLHGSSGNAYQGIYHQLEKARKNGYGLISLQWWRGGDRYMEPRQVEAALYKLWMSVQKQYAPDSERIALETFSRSGAISLEIAYWNQKLNHPHYQLIVVQSGGVPPENPRPLIAKMIAGDLGKDLLTGYRFFMYCGRKDQEWGETMCRNVHYTQKIIQSQGGTVVRLIDDPNGDHGGLHRTPAHAESATQAFLSATR